MKNKICLVLISFVLLIEIFTNSKTAYAVPPVKNPAPSDYSTGLSWEEAQELKKPIVVNFYVDWCHYCKRLAPILDKARENYDSEFSFVFIDCDDPQNSALVNQFRIRAYPSVYIVDKNKKVQVSYSSMGHYDSFKQELDKFLKK